MMKRMLIACLALVMSVAAPAQQSMHTVKRGETYASIASKYNLTEAELKKANPLTKTLYAGTKVYIPVPKETPAGVSPADNTPSARVARAYMENARNYFYEGKYKKAVKELDMAIAEHPTPEAYMMRGKCHFRMEKWKMACSDFDVVYNDPLSTQSQYEESADLYNAALAKRQEKVQKNAQFWGGLAQDALAMAQDMTQQKMLENQMVSQAGHATKDKEFNKNLQNIYRKAGKRARQEQVEGYLSFKNMMLTTTGQDVSYEEYRRLQVEQFTAEQKAKRAAAVEELMTSDDTEEQEEETATESRTGTTAGKSTESTVNKYGTTNSTTTQKTATSTVKKKEEKLDAKQQWKKGKVSSNSFRELHDKFVNLYRRKGDKAQLEYSHKQLYEKGGAYYVEIGGTYYKVEYSNWGAFNKMIIKGAAGNFYFNAHF